MTSVKWLATAYVEGVRVSGRPLTLAEVRRAFEVGFKTAETAMARKKRPRRTQVRKPTE